MNIPVTIVIYIHTMFTIYIYIILYKLYDMVCLPCHRLKSEAEDGGSKNIYPAVDSETSDQLECWCKQLQEIYTSLVISRYQ